MAEGTSGLFHIEIEIVISFQCRQFDYIVAVLNKELTILKYRNIYVDLYVSLSIFLCMDSLQ